MGKHTISWNKYYFSSVPSLTINPKLFSLANWHTAGLSRRDRETQPNPIQTDISTDNFITLGATVRSWPNRKKATTTTES